MSLQHREECHPEWMDRHKNADSRKRAAAAAVCPEDRVPLGTHVLITQEAAQKGLGPTSCDMLSLQMSSPEVASPCPGTERVVGQREGALLEQQSQQSPFPFFHSPAVGSSKEEGGGKEEGTEGRGGAWPAGMVEAVVTRCLFSGGDTKQWYEVTSPVAPPSFLCISVFLCFAAAVIKTN